MNLKTKLGFLCLILVMVLICALPTWGAEKLYKIAVLPFDDGSIKDRWWGGGWEVGKGVSDELVTALLDTHRFRLIEREQIDKVLQEQNFGAAGRVDNKSAAKLGKILGVQLLVMGRVTEFSFKSTGGGLILNNGIGLGVKSTKAIVAIDARLVDTTTAEIITSVTGRGEKPNTNVGLAINWNAIAIGSNEFRQTNLGIALRDAVTQVANGLASKAYNGGGPDSGSLALTGTVFYAKDNKIIINIGSNDGVQQGMIFTVEHVIDVVQDPDTGEIVDRVTEPVAEYTVSEVKDKTATCVLVNRINNHYPITVKDVVKQKL